MSHGAQTDIDGAEERVKRERFVQFVLRNPINELILDRLPALELPDCYLVAGCVYQSVWNGLSGLPATHGIADYDVSYFDDNDLTYDAEDAVIRRCADVFADVDAEIQVRNQARVHLWYPQKFDVPCPPLRSTHDSIRTYLNRSSCFGIRRSPHGFDVYAPYGYDDLFNMVVRPHSRRGLPHVYYEKAARWKAMWPALTVVPWPETGG